ncbi:M48 family metallopeptidase [Consotaella aegiceratis]|uniref:M48 family metallopeptidase n=1 Tax=Consotaella aegiceratis TaxID=3097961 RepID=UPI002F420B01
MTVPLLKKIAQSRRPAALSFPEVLALSNGDVPLTVRCNPRAKRIIMRITPGGAGLTVTVPPRTRHETVLDFLDRHRGWAESRLSIAPKRLTVTHGAMLPFAGGLLEIVHEPSRRVTTLVIGQNDEPSRLLVGGASEHLPRRVADALKREARRRLQAAVDKHAAAVELKPRAMTLKDTTSRWGSCTHDRRLAFSWRIVMAPPYVLDYLVAHEVAHFREMNHSPRFWAVCRSLCPSMEAGKAWLKRHGGSLHGIDFGAA